MFPGMGGSAAAKPRDQQLYGDAANMPLARNLLDYPGRSPSVRPVGMGSQAGYIAPVDSNEFSAGSFYRRPEGTQGIFSDEDQGIGRVGTSGYRGFSPLLSPAARASQGMQSRIAGIEGLIGQISEGRQNLQDAYARQQEMRQGQFNTDWQQYAQQALLAGMYQSPQFGQAAQGMGPGGVPPLSAEEGQYWRGRNAYQGQPGSSQMMDRFGPQSPLTSGAALNAAMFGAQQAGRGVVMQPGGYGSPLEFAPQRQSQADTLQQAEMQQRAGLLDSEGMLNRTYEGPYTRRDRNGDIAYTSREQALRDAGQDSTADGVAAARQAKFDAFQERRKALGLRTRDDIAGRRADRDAERSETMQSRQAQMLSRRGISPLSPEGQSLAPDLYTSIQNRRRGGGASGPGSPLTLTQPDGTATPVTPVPQEQTSRTPQVQGQAGMAIKALQQRPIFAHLGLADAESGPTGYDVAEAVDTKIVRQGLDLSPEELADLHQWAVQASKTVTKDFDPFNTPSIWNAGTHERNQKRWGDLARIPLQDKQAVAKWWDEYKREGKITGGGTAVAQPSSPSSVLNSPLRTGGY